MGKKSNAFNLIVGTMIIFVAITFLAASIDAPLLAVLGLFISPLTAFCLNKRNSGKPKKYYGAVVAVFVICTLFGMGAHGNDSPAEENKTITSGSEVTAEAPETAEKNEDNKEAVITEPEKEKEEPEVNIVAAGGSSAQVHFINTGNSDSILVKAGDKAFLIDGGDNDDEGLVPAYIKGQGITTLNYLISTHPDADHLGGLDAVVNSLSVEQVFASNRSADTKTYRDFINAVANKGLSPSVPLEGSQFDLGDGTYIKFFNTNGGSDANESSLVTLFVNGNDKFLFMGDAGDSTEGEIEADLPDVDVVKIGHHGSKSATTSAFLDKIKPEYAVLLVGADNKYGHPASSTMDKLSARGIKVHRTDECGNIIFESSGNGVSTSCGDGDYSSRSATKDSDSSKNSGAAVTQSSGSTGSSSSNNEEIVVITQSGKKYHREGCRSIKKVKEKISKGQAESKGYEPCKICNP